MSVPLPPDGDEPNSGAARDRRDLKPTEPAVQDAWSLRVATVSGIPIRVHFTFLLLLTYFALSGVGRGGPFLALFFLGVFFCVALHELGHSLVAQRYGYKVRDIVLYPIGGVASIEETPKPRHEFWIAVAGPAVNVVIALLLAGYIAVTGGAGGTVWERIAGALQGMRTEGSFIGGFITALLVTNITLVLFNLIPAFPMDGGRVLRSLLALKIGRLRATRIAAFIGQAIAVLFFLVGLGFFTGGRPNYGLLVIALFVFFGAGQEAQAEQSREVVEDAPVGAAMLRDFATLAVGDTLRHAAEVLLDTSQQDFPVMHGDEVVGVLSRDALLRGLAREGENAYVAGAMDRDVVFARPNDSLEAFLLRPDGVRRAPVLVRDEAEHLVGMLTLDNLMEFLTLRQIARARQERLNDG
jgi:Zn-dependent protease/CBS domain-containing protein